MVGKGHVELKERVNHVCERQTGAQASRFAADLTMLCGRDMALTTSKWWFNTCQDGNPTLIWVHFWYPFSIVFFFVHDAYRNVFRTHIVMDLEFDLA